MSDETYRQEAFDQLRPEPVEDGGPAFPLQNSGYTAAYGGAPGMSLRDYFAGQAIVGILSGSMGPTIYAVANQHGVTSVRAAAEAAYDFADAMIEARKR